MSRIFLDTSAYSAFKKGHSQLRYRIREASQIQLNPVVLGELRAGFLQGTRLRENLSELAQFLASPRVAVLAVDEETAARYAVIFDPLRRAGTPICRKRHAVWIGPVDDRSPLSPDLSSRCGDLRASPEQAEAGLATPLDFTLMR